MASFHPALDATLKWEGLYSDHPSDPGGETFHGIARKRHPNWTGWAIIDALRDGLGFPDGLQTDQRLVSLASRFYRERFWDRILGDQIHDQAAANALFDYAVNVGVHEAVKSAQVVLGVMPDAIVGSVTLAALNSADDFAARLALRRVRFYAGLCERRPALRAFFFGWIRRSIAFA